MYYVHQRNSRAYIITNFAIVETDMIFYTLKLQLNPNNQS